MPSNSNSEFPVEMFLLSIASVDFSLHYLSSLVPSLKKSFRKIACKNNLRGFPGGAVVENLPANAGDTGSSPSLGRSHMPQSD